LHKFIFWVLTNNLSFSSSCWVESCTDCS